MVYDSKKGYFVTFTEGDGGVVLCRIEGKVCFINHHYSGVLPKPGEQWRVHISGEAPSRKNQDRSVFFITPATRISGGYEEEVEQYNDLIHAVASNDAHYDECLWALRYGLAEPTVPGLTQWLRERLALDAKRRNEAAHNAREARALLRQYGFKIFKETLTASGQFCFTTQQFYEAFWAPTHEGVWLVVLTTHNRGYALSREVAGWYDMPGVGVRPPALVQNWNPAEVARLLGCMTR